MFAFFFVISISVTLISDFQTHQPDFEYNPQLDIEIEKRINSQVTYYSTTESDKPRYQRNYFRCVVKTINSEFSKCYAFGVGLTMGSGGALYLSVSNLDSEGTTFKENLANNGGALSIIGGDILISSSTFTSNTAYENGGSIFISASKYGLLTEIDQDVLKPQNTPQKPNVYIGESTSFASNSARNSGGAIYVRSAQALIADKTTFDQNSAQLAGSALYLDTTPANVISSTITSNKIEYSPINTGPGTIFDQRMFKLTNQANGGAICVFTQSEQTGIYTEKNTFSKNSVNGQYSYLIKVPADISFAGGGPIQWISNGECQLSYSPDYPNLIVSLNFKDCSSDNPYNYIENNGLGIPEVKSQNFQPVNDYNIQTSYTPYNVKQNTPTTNPPEKDVAVSSVQDVLNGKMNNFKTISVTPPTPSRTPARYEYQTNSGKSYKVSSISTKIETITLTKTTISHLTTTLEEKDQQTFVVNTYVQIETDIEIITVIDIQAPIYIEQNSQTPSNKSKLPIYIGAAVGAFVLLLLIIILVVIYTKRANDVTSDSDSPQIFMQTETPKISQTMNTTSVTTDNPLFTTTVDEDDPFRMEFESSSSVEEVAVEPESRIMDSESSDSGNNIIDNSAL